VLLDVQGCGGFLFLIQVSDPLTDRERARFCGGTSLDLNSGGALIASRPVFRLTVVVYGELLYEYIKNCCI
jgi:hypothetical protein